MLGVDVANTTLNVYAVAMELQKKDMEKELQKKDMEKELQEKDIDMEHLAHYYKRELSPFTRRCASDWIEICGMILMTQVCR